MASGLTGEEAKSAFNRNMMSGGVLPFHSDHGNVQS